MAAYKLNKQQQVLLECDKTDSIKGFLAIMIMVHHISFYVKDMPNILKLIRYIAFPLVGLFFFFSGYGLYIGMTKKGYWKSYFSKRISRVLLPYFLVATSWAVVEIGGGYKPLTVLINAFSIRVITPMWYVWVSFGSYILFYLVFKYTPKKISIMIFDLLILAYCIVSAVVNQRYEMYASIMGLCAGVHCANRSEHIIKGLENKYALKTASVGLLFFILFCGRLLLSLTSFENRLVHTLLRNLITLLFIGFVICIVQKLKINSMVLKRFGKISYEIYLIHPFVLYTLYKIEFENGKIYNSIIVFGTIALTIMLSIVLQKVCIMLRKIA